MHTIPNCVQNHILSYHETLFIGKLSTITGFNVVLATEKGVQVPAAVAGLAISAVVAVLMAWEGPLLLLAKEGLGVGFLAFDFFYYPLA